MKTKIVHLSLWDCRSVLPLGALKGSQFVQTDDGRDFEWREWFKTRRACNGSELRWGNRLETFSGFDPTTCADCLALWAVVQVMRDQRLEAA